MPSAGVVRLEVEQDGEREGVRVLAAAEDLRTDLLRFMPDGSVLSAEGEGDKGDPVSLLSFAVALASTGAVTELLRSVRDWFGRRPKDSRLIVRDGDGRVVVEITATNVGDAAVVEALKGFAAADRSA